MKKVMILMLFLIQPMMLLAMDPDKKKTEKLSMPISYAAKLTSLWLAYQTDALKAIVDTEPRIQFPYYLNEFLKEKVTLDFPFAKAAKKFNKMWSYDLKCTLMEKAILDEKREIPRTIDDINNFLHEHTKLCYISCDPYCYEISEWEYCKKLWTSHSAQIQKLKEIAMKEANITTIDDHTTQKFNETLEKLVLPLLENETNTMLAIHDRNFDDFQKYVVLPRTITNLIK